MTLPAWDVEVLGRLFSTLASYAEAEEAEILVRCAKQCFDFGLYTGGCP